MQADVGVPATAELVRRLEARGELGDRRGARRRGRRRCSASRRRSTCTHAPAVILVVGVNGTGKTTTIGKLAAKLSEHGRSVVVAAADTFRAAAEEQLEIWAQRAGADFVGSERGARSRRGRLRRDRAAQARGRDVVIVDTAGRLHTQTNLMEELAKVRRVIAAQARRRAARDAARRRRDDRPERRAAGEALRRGGRRHRRRADEARRLGEGRRRDPDRLRARTAGEARRRRRADSTTCGRSTRRLRAALVRRLNRALDYLAAPARYPGRRCSTPFPTSSRAPSATSAGADARRGGDLARDARGAPRAARGGRQLRASSRSSSRTCASARSAQDVAQEPHARASRS